MSKQVSIVGLILVFVLGFILAVPATVWTINTIFTANYGSSIAYRLRHAYARYKMENEPRLKLAELAEKRAEGSPETVYKGEYDFGEDWFSRKAPVWEIALKPYAGKPNLNYLEVGAYEGRSTVWLLENILTHPTSTITVVDVFYDNDAAYSSDLEQRFRANVERAGGSDNLEVFVGWSGEQLRKLPLNHYDIVYIDGGHLARNVLEDAILVARLVRNDGLIIFDDYRWSMAKRGELDTPKLGVDIFMRLYGMGYEVIHNDYQLILRKKPAPAV